jgi:hypothetical protein
MVMPSEISAPPFPIVKPLMVTMNMDAELMEAPEIVRTTAVTYVALQTTERPETLLAPAATLGVTDTAKKLIG